MEEQPQIAASQMLPQAAQQNMASENVVVEVATIKAQA